MTDPDWLALADFLDAHANDMRAWTEDEPKFRAAAVGLRQLADENRALREAIGDPEELQNPGDLRNDANEHQLLNRLRRIAAAAAAAAADRGVTDGEATTSRRPVQFDAYASNPWPDGEATDG